MKDKNIDKFQSLRNHAQSYDYCIVSASGASPLLLHHQST